MRVALIGCSKVKLDHPAPAGQLYQGALFKAAVEYANVACDDWWVLSAKHGLLAKDQVVEPYDLTLTQLDSWHRRHWARNVELAIRARIPYGTTLTFLAGAKYRDWLQVSLRRGYELEEPLAGLGIGQQKAKLKQMTEVAA